MAYQVTRGTVKTLRHVYICGAVKVAWRAGPVHWGDFSWLCVHAHDDPDAAARGMSDYWANRIRQ